MKIKGIIIVLVFSSCLQDKERCNAEYKLTSNELKRWLEVDRIRPDSTNRSVNLYFENINDFVSEGLIRISLNSNYVYYDSFKSKKVLRVPIPEKANLRNEYLVSIEIIDSVHSKYYSWSSDNKFSLSKKLNKVKFLCNDSKETLEIR